MAPTTKKKTPAKKSVQKKNVSVDRNIQTRLLEVILGLGVFMMLLMVVVVLIEANHRVLAERIQMEVKLDKLFSINNNTLLRLARSVEKDGNTDRCTVEECLMRNDMYGIATVEGYYEEYDTDGVLCDSIVLVGGSARFLETYAAGNPFADDTEVKRLAIEVAPLKSVAKKEASLLLNSQGDSPVQIHLMRPILDTEDNEGETCGSPVELLSVQKL